MGEHIATADPSFRTDQASAFEREEDLLQIGLRESCSVGDVSHRGRPEFVGVKG
jgi:hypothetical protein